MSEPVLFEERVAHNGARIGVARLNAEKTLNALSLEMVELLNTGFSKWATDPAIALVALESTGDKAFCAGGDLQHLQKSILQHHASPQRDDIRGNKIALEFFSREYRLDYMIHTYPKPMLCWGHGIVMGGGLGLMAGASHRVVTESSRVAMPEISIGLYPDVGGTWFLSRMPGKVGLFLALTGATMRAPDALFAGVADYEIRHSDKAQVFDMLLRQPWTESRQINHRYLANLLCSMSCASDGKAPVRQHFDLINQLCDYPRLAEIIAAITGLMEEDPWLTQAGATLAAGSPSSAAVAHALQQRAGHLPLADVFRIELAVSMHCAAHPDFAEGIRALLIDKDRSPRWRPASHQEVTQTGIDEFFVDPWQGREHPLADLE